MSLMALFSAAPTVKKNVGTSSQQTFVNVACTVDPRLLVSNNIDNPSMKTGPHLSMCKYRSFEDKTT